MYWRILGGGHILTVASCSVNQSQIMWALGYDSRAWSYTGGWGGAHFQGSSKSDLLGPVEDSRYYYLYENQRWNPITGFTSHGLPTDRYVHTLPSKSVFVLPYFTSSTALICSLREGLGRTHLHTCISGGCFQ